MGEVCILVSQERAGWIEARKACEVRGARLVRLERERRRSAVLALLRSQLQRPRAQFWLAASDIEVEGEWEWAWRGGPVTWAEQPYNSPEENCLAWTVESRTEFWHGASCCNNLRYICELQ